MYNIQYIVPELRALCIEIFFLFFVACSTRNAFLVAEGRWGGGVAYHCRAHILVFLDRPSVRLAKKSIFEPPSLAERWKRLAIGNQLLLLREHCLVPLGTRGR